MTVMWISDGYLINNFGYSNALGSGGRFITVWISCVISLPLFITWVDQSATVKNKKHNQPAHHEKWKRVEAADFYDTSGS